MPRTTFVFRVLDNVSDLFVSSADVLSILSLSVMFVYFVPFWFSFRALSLVDTTNSTPGVYIVIAISNRSVQVRQYVSLIDDVVTE